MPGRVDGPAVLGAPLVSEFGRLCCSCFCGSWSSSPSVFFGAGFFDECFFFFLSYHWCFCDFCLDDGYFYLWDFYGGYCYSAHGFFNLYDDDDYDCEDPHA